MSSVISALSTISSILFNQMESYPVVSLLTTMTHTKKKSCTRQSPSVASVGSDGNKNGVVQHSRLLTAQHIMESKAGNI
jgi:hypothetical protein